MSKLDIIGLAGKSGTGKDHIAKIHFQPLGFKPFSFAWHPKVFLVGKGLATHEEVFVTKPPHIRTLLQDDATRLGRDVYGKDVWCRTLIEWMRVVYENWGETKFVIPDVRFLNEAEHIKAAGGRVIQVYAPIRAANNQLTEEQRRHQSETELDTYIDFDGILHNDVPFDQTISQQLSVLL
jgi:hypothetical protein